MNPSYIFKKAIVEDVLGGGYKAVYGKDYEWGNTPQEAKLALVEKLQKRAWIPTPNGSDPV